MSANAIKIDHSDLKAYSDVVDNAIKSTKYTPNINSKVSIPGVDDGVTDVVSMTGYLINFGDFGMAMPNEFNHLYLRLRTGLMLGYHFIKLYDDVVDIEKVPETMKSKVYASNVLFSLVVARTVLESEIFQTALPNPAIEDKLPELPEFNYNSIVDSRNWLLYYLTQYLDGYAGHSITDAITVVKFVMERVLSNAVRKINAGEAQELAPIMSLVYNYEGAGDDHTGEMSISLNQWVDEGVGFISETNSGFDFITDLTFADMVGNDEIKLQSKRLMNGLLCYCMEEQRNPFADMGGYQATPMWSGIPGVGKSMLVEIMLNYIHGIASELGIPVIRNSFDNVSIDSYQGKSEQDADRWFQYMNNPNALFLADIDDGENKLRNRLYDDTSEGVRGVVASFLRNTEGAGAYFRVRNNILMPILTNMAQTIDPAVLSRIKSKTEIAGAVSHHDFMDLIWLGSISKNQDIFSTMGEFWDIDTPTDYNYMDAQKSLKTMMSRVRKDTHEYGLAYDTVDQIINTSLNDYKKTSPEFLGSVHHKFKQQFQTYSPRDVRNINGLVDARMMDFDFPDEWFSDTELFFGKSYDDKKIMLTQCSIDSTNGKSYTDIMLEEMTEYMANLIIIQNKEFNASVTKGVKQMEIQDAVMAQRNA